MKFITAILFTCLLTGAGAMISDSPSKEVSDWSSECAATYQVECTPQSLTAEPWSIFRWFQATFYATLATLLLIYLQKMTSVRITPQVENGRIIAFIASLITFLVVYDFRF